MKKILFFLGLLFLVTNLALAQSPQKFNFQGIARTTAGQPLINQNISLRLSILDGSASGTSVYSETQTVSTNSFGLYNLAIGSGTVVSGSMATVGWGSGDKYLKVEIDPAGGSNYTDLGASQLLSVPYAMYSASGSLNGTTNTLTKFTGANSGGNSQVTDDGTSVGINVPTLSSNIKLQVMGTGGNTIRATLTGTPSTSIATSGAIYGESTTGIGVIGVSGTQNGVYGLSTGTLGGVTGVNSGTGNAVWGVATGGGNAGYFDGGTTGKGVIVATGASGFGTTTPANRLAVIQPATPVPATDTNAAILAYSYTSQGCLKGAVSGSYNGSNYGVGVQGIGYNGINNNDLNASFALGSQDLGVYGSANTAGVEGVSVSGIGVIGYNKAGSFAATTGLGNSYGVFGSATTIGGATAPAARYGVYGNATGAATNYAGYFAGNVSVTGSLSKGGGTFKIDHPLDPENKYLYHSFVESPDMMNVYNGNITTDASGNATVTLPDYFESLNKDFRYQLTVIGVFAQAIVSSEVNNNSFSIKTDKPNIKVSWQVTGIRQDKWANAHRVVPEVEKEPEFKGHYLHPQEWNMPEEKGINYLTNPQTTPAPKK